MDKLAISRFRFLKYYISDMEFKINKNYENSGLCDDLELQIEMGVAISVVSEDAKKIMISLSVDIFKDYLEKCAPYFISLTMDGFFELEENMEYDEIENFCRTSGVSIMFPYVRSAVTDLTKIANQDALVLPLINVKKLVEGKTMTKQNSGNE